MSMTTLLSEWATLSSGPQAATRSHSVEVVPRPYGSMRTLFGLNRWPGAVHVLRAVHPVGIAHPGRHPDDVDVPEVEGPVDARVELDGLDRLRRVVALEDEQLDARRVLREEGEVGALGVGRRAERMGATGPDGEASGRGVARSRARPSRSSRSPPRRSGVRGARGSPSPAWCRGRRSPGRCGSGRGPPACRRAPAAPRPRRRGPPRRPTTSSPTRAIDWDLSLSR